MIVEMTLTKPLPLRIRAGDIHRSIDEAGNPRVWHIREISDDRRAIKVVEVT